MSDTQPSRPSADLGKFTVAPFQPGRFASAIQMAQHRTDGLLVTRDSMTSSFVLELKPDRSATVCRGWQYLSSSDGPDRRSMEHLREQLGYSGEWEERDGWVEVELHRDVAVCEPVAEYTHLVPTHADQWNLRCVLVSGAGAASPIEGPVLACQAEWGAPRFGEDGPHTIAGFLPGTWILLAEGNGLRIRSSAKAVGSAPVVPEVEVERSPIRVEANSWMESF